jgi:hypothetical protein
MQRARVLIHLIVFAFAATISSAALDHDAIFDSRVGHDCFRDLLRKNGWGLAGTFERAAFVIEQSDGSFVCQAWPSMHTYLSESFRGFIPPHTVAIVHTHPVDFPKPSVQDQNEATRLEMPIYVVTIRGVYKAVPRVDQVSVLANTQAWIRETPASTFSGSAVASR